MFGEEYFKTRKRLTSVVLRVLELADKTGADKTPLLENDITNGLSNPFLFVLCGEVNAGKSTLLNGLFGEVFCKTNVLPETDRVHWYRYNEKNYNKEITPILEERYRPIEFLMDFNLVDTPGTNSVVEGHEKITARFLPVSDLIMWVFPASNPWGASTWDFIQNQNEEMLSKSIFIVQQADLRDEEDLDVILRHIADLANKRIGMVPPIFPVSAKLALHAKTETPFDEALWQISGYPALEKHISGVVTDSPFRHKTLGNARHAAAMVLRNIEGMVELRTQLLDKNEYFLREIEAEIDQERENKSVDFVGRFTGMREVFVAQSEEIKSLVSKKLSVIPTLKSFFSTENIPKLIESSLVDSVKHAVENQALHDGEYLEAECYRHWEGIRPRVREKLAIELGSFQEAASGFSNTRQRFIKRIGRASRQAVVDLKIRVGIDMQLAERRRQLKRWLYGILVCLILAGTSGGLKITVAPYLALAFLTLAVIFAAVFIILTFSTRAGIQTSLSEMLGGACTPFADALEDDYRDGVRDFYIEYGSLLKSIRSYISDAKLELQPNLEQWNGLFLELKEIEQDL